MAAQSTFLVSHETKTPFHALFPCLRINLHIWPGNSRRIPKQKEEEGVQFHPGDKTITLLQLDKSGRRVSPRLSFHLLFPLARPATAQAREERNRRPRISDWTIIVQRKKVWDSSREQANYFCGFYASNREGKYLFLIDKRCISLFYFQSWRIRTC